MMKRMSGYVAGVLLMFALGCLAVGCSDDTETMGQGSSEGCSVGETYNPLSGRCEPEVRGGGNNGAPNNDNGGDGPNNDDPNDENGGDAGNGDDQRDDAGNDDGSGNDDAGGDTGNDDDSGNNNGGDDNDDDNDVVDPPEGCGPGAIIGKACAPSGETLGGATVTLEGFDCDGNPYTETAQTDANGDFQFDDVPAGQHTLTISTGSFSRNQTIIVQTGVTLDLSTAAAKVCLEGGNVEIAVIEGAYDHVSGVLDDVGLDYTIVGNDRPGGFWGLNPPSGHTFLMDPATMNQYDIIFINCGDLWDNIESLAPTEVNTVISNLQSYLAGGNSLYVSDWAHPFIEKVYPNAIDFYGDDATIDDARMGYAPQTIAANVTSPGLQTALGHNQATIDFPHSPPTVFNDHWVVAAGAAASSTVHLEGAAQLCPSDGCDSPSGSQPGAPLLITYQDPSGGTAIFTSFHNERQAAINQDMERILRFLIFQL